MPSSRRWRGSVQQQRPHQQYTAGLQFAHSLATALHKSADLTLRNLAKYMSTRQNAKRAILLRAIVKMRSDGKHALQYIGGRLHMQHSSLCRPRPISFSSNSVLHSNRYILMPRNLPVRRIGLVEQNAANRFRLSPKNRIHQRTNSQTLSQLLNLWNLQKISNAPTTPLTRSLSLNHIH